MGLDRRSSLRSRTVAVRISLMKFKLLQRLAPVDQRINEEEPAALNNIEGDNAHFLMKFKVTPRGRQGFRVRPAVGEPLCTFHISKQRSSARPRPRSSSPPPPFFTPPKMQVGRVTKIGWFGLKWWTENLRQCSGRPLFLQII